MKRVNQKRLCLSSLIPNDIRYCRAREDVNSIYFVVTLQSSIPDSVFVEQRTWDLQSNNSRLEEELEKMGERLDSLEDRKNDLLQEVSIKLEKQLVIYLLTDWLTDYLLTYLGRSPDEDSMTESFHTFLSNCWPKLRWYVCGIYNEKGVLNIRLLDIVVASFFRIK